MASVISSRLDLLVRLIDTTTGAAVEETNVLFMRDEVKIRPESRGPGTYVFINTGREDFLMRIKVKGFDEYESKVVYEGLNERIPVFNAFLIPSENAAKGERVLTLSGNLPFLEALEAVNLNRIICHANQYDKKTKVLGVFGQMGGKVFLYDTWYGLLDGTGESFEKIEVVGNETPQSVLLRNPPEMEIQPNTACIRVVFGSVKENGDYVLRIRDDGAELKYLIRYVVKGEARFKTVDFREGAVLS